MNKQKGFTLIELLIVIVVLGILAVAILSAINPIEQINKATDSGTQSDAAELINALERYYASNQSWPWAGTQGGLGTGWVEAGKIPGLSGLADTGEVKSEFISRDNLNYVYVKLQGSGSSEYIIACFEPVSQTFKKNLKQMAPSAECQLDGKDSDATAGDCFCVPAPTSGGSNNG